MAVAALALTALVAASAALAADATAPAGQIAWVDVAGELWAGKPDGSDARQLGPQGEVQPISFSLTPVQDLPQSFRWPLWSPDGTRVAAFHITQSAGPATSRLYVLDAASGRVVHSFGQLDLRPIYAYWAPDGSRFAFLHQTGKVHTLSLWPAEDRDEPRKVAAGLPLFFDWRRDSRGLVLHVAREPESKLRSSVTLLDPANGSRTLRTSSPAAFGPASWSPNGKRLAYGIEEPNGEAHLVVEREDGSKRHKLTRIDPESAFSWSPDSRYIAVGKTTDERAPLLTQLDLITVKGGAVKTLAKEVFGCFFWSPQSDRILYAKRDLDRGDWEWVLVDVASGAQTRLTRFQPSPALVFVFQFFDQYALSHRFWSPDGKAFTFTGWRDVDPAMGGPGGPPEIWIVPAEKGGKAKSIGQGHVAFWSPK